MGRTKLNGDDSFSGIDPNTQARLVCGVRHREPLDEEEDFFEIGLARTHGFLKDDSLELTEAGKKRLKEIILKAGEDNED